MENLPMKICPKCKGTEIDNIGLDIPIGEESRKKEYTNLSPINNNIDVIAFICINCGYIEFYHHRLMFATKLKGDI